MGDVLGVLCALGGGIILLALIGHGLWLVAAAVGRTIAGPSAPTARKVCPVCQAVIPPERPSCVVCGAAVSREQDTTREPSSTQPLERLAQQLERMHRMGLIDPLAFERLNDAVQKELIGAHEQVREQVRKEALASVAAAPEPPPAVSEEAVEPIFLADDYPLAAPIAVTSSAGLAASEAPQSLEPIAPAAKPAAPPLRSWGVLLDRFMEERNLRWGELIGGMLIVCGSIALVLSFWTQIAERPFLKFVVFNGFTAGMFGLGVYADRRLRLATTGRAMFSIATLLVPLNFLAFAAFPRASTAEEVTTIIGEAVSIVLFAWLLVVAGRTITPGSPLLLAAGVLGPSVAALLVRRFIQPGASVTELYALGLLPVALYVAAVGGMLRRAAGPDEPTESDVHSMFRFLAGTTFACVLPLGLIVMRAGDVAGTLRWLAPLISLSAAPALATGLSIWKRVISRERSGLRTTGSGVAIAGTLILALAVVLAWPHPAIVVLVSLATFAVLTTVARTQTIPAAHLLALPALGLAYLIAVHVGRGELTWGLEPAARMTGALLSAASGTALVPLAALFGGLAAWLFRRRRDDGRFYGLAALLIAGLSLALVTCFGLGRAGDPGGASWVYGLYAVLLLAGAWIMDRGVLTDAAEGAADSSIRSEDGKRRKAVRMAAWCGATLLLVSFVQGAAFRWAEPLEIAHPWLLAFLAHASAVVAAAAAASWWLARSKTESADDRIGIVPGILTEAAAITSAVAALGVVGLIPTEAPGFIASRALWLSVLWGALAWLRDWRPSFLAFQGALTAAVIFGVAAGIRTRPWAAGRALWLDPWSWQIQGIAMAVLGLGWSALRVGFWRRQAAAPEDPAALPAGGKTPSPPGVVAKLRVFLDRDRISCDRVAGWLVLTALMMLGIYGALPGVAQELSPHSLAVALETARGVAVPPAGRVVPALANFEFAGIPHDHALQFGSWLLVGLTTLLFAAWHMERFRTRDVAGILIALSAACPLLAGRWESDVAAASALRWGSAIFLALASAAIWARQPIAQRVGLLARPSGSPWLDAAGRLTALVLIVAAAPLLAMALFVGSAAISQYAVEDALRSMVFLLGLLGFFASPVGLALRLGSARWLAALPAETALATAAAARRRRAAGGLRQASMLTWVLGIGPLLAVVLYIVSAALRGNPIVGPEPGTLFHRMGLAASYAVPPTLCAFTLVGYAVRERSAGFAFAAGLLFNVSATAAYLLLAVRGGAKLDTTLWIRLTQVNAIVSAVCALVWMTAAKLADQRRRIAEAMAASAEGRPLLIPAGMPIPPLLVTQSLIGVALVLLLLVPGFIGFVASRVSTPALVALAEPLGRTAWFLAVAAIVGLSRLGGMRFAPGAVCVGLWSAAMMATFYACGWDDGNGVAYRTMLATHGAAAWLLLLGFAAWEPSSSDEAPTRGGVTVWTSLLGVLLVVLAVRDAGDHDRLWADVAAIGNVGVLSVALACGSKSRGFLYGAGLLASLARSIWWFFRSPAGLELPDLVTANVTIWLLPALVSLLVENRLIRPAEEPTGHDLTSRALYGGIGFHRAIAVFSLVCMAILALGGLSYDAFGTSQTTDASSRWMALASAGAMVLACLWESRSVAPLFALYLFGLTAGATAIDLRDLAPRRIAWNGALFLASFSFAGSLLWLARQRITDFGRRCRIPSDESASARAHAWLVPMTVFLGGIVLVTSAGIDLDFAERALRLATGSAALLPALAMGFLSRRGEDHPARATALFFGVGGAIVWGWAWQDPGSADALHRFVVMTAALAGMTVLYGLGPGKFLPAENDWSRAARSALPKLCVLTAGSVLLEVGREASLFVAGRDVALSWPGILVMSLTILGLCAACLAAALVPGRDPFRLSERGRTVYVYAAEALLAVLFAHIRFTMPWLFHGFFSRYWPFIVMFIAFVGAGMSEIFRRQNRLVLAEPLERTGALLPLLPVLGFAVMPSEVHLSLTMLAAAAVYSTLSILRRSFVFGALAALAANGGLWYFLHHTPNYGLLQHPQLWLIPFALCVLGAAYLNQDRLSPDQMATIRYLASITIYVSSTADIFINGTKESPWLTVVLAGLSVAGVFAGILLRVRAFLMLGTGFLVLAMLTMIWHAAVDLHQNWVIWATVVLAGVMIIALFAVFEKKRQEVLAMVDRIREWQP